MGKGKFYLWKNANICIFFCEIGYQIILNANEKSITFYLGNRTLLLMLI